MKHRTLFNRHKNNTTNYDMHETPENERQMDKLKNFDSIRLQELDDLQKLIRLAMELNNGSGVVQKIQIIEVLAHKLTKTDFVTPRSSFILWLSEMINDLHKQHNNQPADPRYAQFGEAMWNYITNLGGDFCGNEISEDILPLAQSAGLCCRVEYDQKIHGTDIEAELGDEIWWWGDFD